MVTLTTIESRRETGWVETRAVGVAFQAERKSKLSWSRIRESSSSKRQQFKDGTKVRVLHIV